jgi:hypothetical protein
MFRSRFLFPTQIIPLILEITSNVTQKDTGVSIEIYADKIICMYQIHLLADERSICHKLDEGELSVLRVCFFACRTISINVRGYIVGRIGQLSVRPTWGYHVRRTVLLGKLSTGVHKYFERDWRKDY